MTSPPQQLHLPQIKVHVVQLLSRRKRSDAAEIEHVMCIMTCNFAVSFPVLLNVPAVFIRGMALRGISRYTMYCTIQPTHTY